MVAFEPFTVEEWMDEYELKCKHNIAETCCASISLDQLQELCEDKTKTILPASSTKLSYGSIRGSDQLRSNLASLYSSKSGSRITKDHVLITQGAIAANHLFLLSYIGPGDHVICHHPTYQQLYSVPASLGAEVSLWTAKPENKWVPNIEELKSLIKPNTKLIIINNPNNPTGAVLGRSFLAELTDVAREKSITILSDEVYRPIFHGISPISPEFPPSMISMYENAIVTGSLSKAYSLAGIRCGWIASKNTELIERCAAMRHYTTISVSMLDDAVATFALDPNTIHALLGRNIALAKKNLEILDLFVIKHDDICEYVKPVAGTTAFLRFHRDSKPIDAKYFCKQVLERCGALVLPGDVCFGEQFKGYVRIGFVQETEVVETGLKALQGFLRKEFDDLPLHEDS